MSQPITTRLLKDIGKQVKRLREAKGMNQGELADKVNLTRAYISRLESGKINATLSHLQDIAKALKVKLRILFTIPLTKKDIKKSLNKM